MLKAENKTNRRISVFIILCLASIVVLATFLTLNKGILNNRQDKPQENTLGLNTATATPSNVSHETSNNIITEEEAISFSMPYIENYVKTHNRTIKSINASMDWVRTSHETIFDSSPKRPSWEVWASFGERKDYVVAYAVLIWADTGVIRHYGPQGYW